ncbi:MAG: glucose 1-dehydrogenase [Verrucomicrobia bacterium]|nr:glucose 1-dehydrogenase [Verrucomicrobiota bacterium]
MPIPITVPRLGWTMEEGTFVGWLKKDGDTVRAGEPLFTLDGDKALQEIEATDNGLLHIPPDAPKPGSTVRVGDLLGYLLAKDERHEPTPTCATSPQTSVSRATSEKTAIFPSPLKESEREPMARSSKRVTISPRARRIATELGVDWEALRGTGKKGRIRARDVLAAAHSSPRVAPSLKITFSLKDKVTIVTGAASGIGAAIAEAFAQAGAIVYIADLNESGATEHAQRIVTSGGRAHAIATNVADPSSCEALLQRVLMEHARCDVLVNNAGIGHVGTILTTAPEDLQRLWAVNVQGLYFLSRAALPSMIARRRGSIINMASALGLTAMEDRFAYTVTKHAVVGLTRSMALDFGATGVRINCICPGRVETPFVQARLREYPDPEKFRAQMVATHAQKRMAQPWEIAAAAVYLASDESAFVTGSTFVIDGGYLCGK